MYSHVRQQCESAVGYRKEKGRQEGGGEEGRRQVELTTRKKEVKGRKKEVYREQHRAQPSVSAVLQATVLKLIILLQYCSLITFYHHTRILSAQ